MVEKLSVNITGKFIRDKLITGSLQDTNYSLLILKKCHTIDKSFKSNESLSHINLFVAFMFQRMHFDEIVSIFKSDVGKQVIC